MKTVGFSVAALALMASSGTAFAASESGKVMSTIRAIPSAASNVPLSAVQSSAKTSTWYGALNAPGGLAAYRSPSKGFILPAYWMQPNFFIEDYARYGFAAPQDGYGWSRYYEDAVLTDSTGRITDIVKDVDWNRFGGGQFDTRSTIVSSPSVVPGVTFQTNPSFPPTTVPGGVLNTQASFPPQSEARDFDREVGKRRGRGIGSIASAAIGATVGGLAGALIGGRGERLAGSLIGGGVGALAGLAIGEATRGGRGRHHGGHRYPPRGPHWSHGGGYYPGGFYYETYETVNYIPVAPITTTTTTTKVYYETITTAKSNYSPKRPHKHRPHQCRCHR